MPIGSIHEVAEALFEFEPQFNDKIATLIVPARNEKLALTRSQFKALILLMFGPGRTATELGEALGMTKASLTGILDVLESLGLAARKSDPEDRRKARLYLTAAGRKLCEGKKKEFDAKLEARLATLSDADRAALARHLAAAASILKKLEER